MKHGKLTPYLFLTPMIVGLLVFRLGPVFVAMLAGFSKWNIQTPPQFMGMANYAEAISSEIFWQVTKNTVLFAVFFVPGVMILAMIMALMVNQKLRGIAFFRGLYFLPYITAMVAVAMVWNWIFATRFGVLNYILRTFLHISDPPAWLADAAWALPALAIVAIWKTRRISNAHPPGRLTKYPRHTVRSGSDGWSHAPHPILQDHLTADVTGDLFCLCYHRHRCVQDL